MSRDERTFAGQCYCGAVRIEVTGDPVGAGYASTALPMKDGLPKLKDFPAELGGSGEAVTE